MASVIIPISVGVPDQQLQVELDSVTYTLRFVWNARANGWFVSLMDAEENPVLMGRRLVVSWPIWGRFVGRPLVPPGLFEAIDTSGQDLEAGLDDLGDRVQVMYTPEADLT